MTKIENFTISIKLQVKDIEKEFPIYAGRKRPIQYTYTLFINNKKIKTETINAYNKDNLTDSIKKKIEIQLKKHY